jgi:hypothetical protein
LAGRKDSPVIPDLYPFKTEQLGKAEVSLYYRQPQQIGLRFLIQRWEAFEDFIKAANLPEDILVQEKQLRDRFDLVPGHWIKIGYRAGMPKIFSQYFAVMPGHYYPITTLRIFLKMYGCQDVKRLEVMLEPGLIQDDSVWNLALKRDGGIVQPRIYGRIGRDCLPEIFHRMVTVAYMDRAVARRYLEWNDRITAGDLLYLSLDPGPGQAAAVDYEEIPVSDLPISKDGFAVDFPAAYILPYLKCRIKDGFTEPEWVAHLPWSEFQDFSGR